MQDKPCFLDSLKQLIDLIFHRECGKSKMECAKLKQLNEHYAAVPAKQVAVSHNLALHKPGAKLVAYTRDGGPNNTVEMQKEKIDEYCRTHDYSVLAHYSCDKIDEAHPLNDAITNLDNASGLIVSDLSRLVMHHEDPLRDLAPLMHEYFFHNSKILISVKEGINTGSTEGQEALVQFMNELHDVELGTC